MTTHSSILAWEIPWTEEPGRLQSMGSQKNRVQLSDWTTTKNSLKEFPNFGRPFPSYVVKGPLPIRPKCSGLALEENVRAFQNSPASLWCYGREEINKGGSEGRLSHPHPSTPDNVDEPTDYNSDSSAAGWLNTTALTGGTNSDKGEDTSFMEGKLLFGVPIA